MNDPLLLLRAIVALAAPLLLATLRLVPATMMLPLFGGRAMPTTAKTPVLVVLAVGAVPSLLAPRVGATLSIGLVLCALRELWLGLLLALVLSAPFFAIEHAGRILDQTRGASSSELSAPDSSARSTPLAELFRWTFGAAFVASGGLRAIVLAVAQSFARYPVETQATALPSLERSTLIATRWAADSLSYGLALAGSGLLALFAAEASIAVASRIAPPIAQSNLAAPARALVALLLVALTIRAVSDANLALARAAMDAARTL